MARSRTLAFLIKELKEVLPPTVFFAVSFNIIVLTTQLLLADYAARFMVATCRIGGRKGSTGGKRATVLAPL